MLDAGNALFPGLAMNDARSRARAELVLEAMGEVGALMAPGARDFGPTPRFLVEAAAKAKVPVLSANLLGPDGKPVFPASRRLERGGVRVGVIGVSPEGPVLGAPDFRGAPALAAVKAEAERLRPDCDLLVLLAPIGLDKAAELAREAGVDWVLAAGTRRDAGDVFSAGAWVATSGDRGRELGILSLDVRGPGAFAERGAKASAPNRFGHQPLRLALELAEEPNLASRVRALDANP